MTNDAERKQERSTASRIAPYLVLALMLAASIWLWRYWDNVETAREQNHFNEYCARISHDIANRTETYRSTPQFNAEKQPRLSWTILATGLAFSIAVFLLMRSQSSIVAKAEVLAAELTVDLRKSEQHLNHLNTISPAVVYTLAPADFSLTWVSPNVTALTGYALEEALQPGWWAGHLHPEDRKRVLARSADGRLRGHPADQGHRTRPRHPGHRGDGQRL